MTSSWAYYNENDPYAAAWLRELISAQLIAPGEVDDRSIEDVDAGDLCGFAQCHFFAGIGGWSYALRLAGWSDNRPVWTGSCPCLPFSSAARGRHVAADLWPELHRLLATGRPRTFFGEQVAVAISWFDRVCADMEALDYAVGAAILPAVSVGADHARPRIYFVGDTNTHGKPERTVDAETPRMPRYQRHARAVVLPHGISRDMVAFSGFGNAVIPQLAAEFIKAYAEVTTE